MIRKNLEHNGFQRVKYLDHRVDKDHGDEDAQVTFMMYAFPLKYVEVSRRNAGF